jgi:hypothetical protein
MFPFERTLAHLATTSASAAVDYQEKYLNLTTKEERL